jgi:hypothetical protein
MALSFCQVLSFVAANSFGCIESLLLHGFSPSVGYAKSRFCYLGTYLSGISHSVNGLAWGRFCIIFFFSLFFWVTRAFLLARNIDSWSRSTLAVHCGWGDSRSLHWGRPRHRCEGIMCPEQAFDSLSNDNALASMPSPLQYWLQISFKNANKIK